MPFNSVWDQRNKTAALIIPLMMQRKRDEQELTLKAQELKLKEDELRAEKEERSNKIKEAMFQTNVDLYKEAMKNRDQASAQSLGPDIRAGGINIPARETPSAAARDMSYDEMYQNQKTLKPNLEFLVPPKEEKPVTGMDQLIATLPNRTPEEKIKLKQRLFQKNDTPSALKKLIEERDALPEGDQARTLYDQAITKAISSKGMVIESDGKGGFTIKTNADTNAGGLQRSTLGKIETSQIAANEGLSRISKIVKSFKPEFQEIPTKLGVAWSGLKSKMGANIPPEEKAKLEEFSVFKQDALENINLYIKEITGAQMSEKEADRLRKAMPDPGDGIFGGDDPVSFKSKLTNTYKKLRLSAIRHGHYIKQGLGEDTIKNLIKSDSIVSLEEMEKILDSRGEIYEAELRKQNPNISTADLFSQVKAQLAKEFNMGF